MENKIPSLKIMLLSAMLAGSSFTAYADNGTIIYSGNTGKGSVSYFGTSKKESYDVAILLADKNLKGKTIQSIRVPFGDTYNLENIKLWVSSKLALDNKQNAPDIMTLDATVSADEAVATLSQPYTINTDTLYIGCSFDVPEVVKETKTPVQVTSEASDAGLYLHTSRTYRKWMDKSNLGTSTIEVNLGGADADAASITGLPEMYGQVNTPTGVSLTVRNSGYNGVKSIDYSYVQGDTKGTGHIDLDQPIPAIYNASADLDVTLQGMSAKGNYPVQFTIDRVNGQANSNATVDKGNIIVYNTLPKHNAVMEEFTGLWCGWCPRGFVALELMNKKHSDFIGLSYHNGDVMTFTNNYPVSVGGFPSASIDRKNSDVDPYYGSSNGTKLGIEDDWKRACKEVAPAAMSASATLDDAGTNVSAKAVLTFPVTRTDANYKVEFVLIADDLHGEGSGWDQSNYYSSNYSSEFDDPIADPFLAGGTVSGLHFNDVAVATTRLSGTSPSVPSTVNEDEPVEVTASFDLSSVHNSAGQPIIQDINKLRVAALLIASDGTIANGAKCNVVNPQSTGITTLTDGEDIVPMAIYDMQGRKRQTMQSGVNIVKLTSGKTVKMLIK